MRPNDETIYQDSEVLDRNENEETKMEMNEKKESPKSEKKSGGWAKLAIGGVSGIFMGAGAMYAGKPYIDDMAGDWKESLHTWAKKHGLEDKLPEWLKPDHETEQKIVENEGGTKPEDNPETANGGKEDGFDFFASGNDHAGSTGQSTTQEPHVTHTSFVPGELHVATVDQNLSFGEAFAQARAEVGAGGVFHWHGGVFNTYTEAEWNTMSPADHNAFAQHVAPEVQHTLPNDLVNEPLPESEPDIIQVGEPVDEEPDVVMINAPEPEHAPESDVHILGVNQYVGEDGSVMNAGFSVIDGEPVVMLDGDGDGVFEGEWHDLNGNQKMDENEVLDISDNGTTVEEVAAIAIAQGNSEDGSFNPHPQDDLAQDTPDYMNDADTSDIFEA